MTNHRRRLILKIFLPFISILLLTQQSHGREQILPKTMKLKVVNSPYLSYAPFFIAQEEGYFTEQGLDVEFIMMTNAAEALPSLIQGDVHALSYIVVPSQLNAISRGGKIKIVADKGYLSNEDCTYTAFMVRKSLMESGELIHPSQLKGRRFGMDHPSSSSGYLLEKILHKTGLTMSDIEFLSIPMLTRLEAFKKGTIDLSLVSEPWITQMLQSGHSLIWKPAQEIAPDFQIAFVMFGPVLLHQYPDMGRKLMTAYLKAVRQYNQGKTERNINILNKNIKMEKELLKICCWPSIRGDGKINIESILDFQSWALKKGFLDKEVPPNQFWDPSFIEYANKVLGKSAP